MTSKNTHTYSIDELASLVEMPRRTLRYYIQEGLVDRPVGEKRGAYYTNRHLEQLLTIRKWQHAGVSLERIKEILGNQGVSSLPPLKMRGPGTVEVWSHMVVTDGLEINIEPSRAGLNSRQVRHFFKGVTALFESIRQEGDENDLE